MKLFIISNCFNSNVSTHILYLWPREWKIVVLEVLIGGRYIVHNREKKTPYWWLYDAETQEWEEFCRKLSNLCYGSIRVCRCAFVFCRWGFTFEPICHDIQVNIVGVCRNESNDLPLIQEFGHFVYPFWTTGKADCFRLAIC